jgi:hypothetical protein
VSKNIFIDTSNAMNTQPYIEQFLFNHLIKKISFHNYISVTVIYLTVTSGKLEWLNLTSLERHKFETHFKITYSSSNLFHQNSHKIYQIARCHAPESNVVKSEEVTSNS